MNFYEHYDVIAEFGGFIYLFVTKKQKLQISDFDYQLLVQVEICLDKQFNTIDCDDMRDKLMFNPSKGTYIFPCHGDSDVRYVPFSE